MPDVAKVSAIRISASESGDADQAKAAPQHHGDSGKEIGDRSRKTDLERAEAVGLDHLRHPEAHAVEPDHHAEIDETEHEHAGARQRLAEIGVADATCLIGLDRKRARERLPLFRLEPTRLFGTVVEVTERDQHEPDRRQALDNEQPLPAFESEEAMHLKQRAGNQ